MGNDIVVIVFQDSDTPFQVSTLTSKQNHLICVVRKSGDGYVLTMVYKNGVPAFTPELPEPTYMDRNAVSRDFFLHKRKQCSLASWISVDVLLVVNGERACYKAPSFVSKISRTRSVLLFDVAQRFLGSSK